MRDKGRLKPGEDAAAPIGWPEPDPDPCDILVIGGGPAGSTAAALLAERGRDVVLLEKETHPRFHIGESLLPRNLAVLDRLGLREGVHEIGVLKPGAEFVSDDTGASVAFDFSKGLDRQYTYSYQVPRARFDELLFVNARRKGVRAAEGVKVTDVSFGAATERVRVEARKADGTPHRYAARFILDASGRDTFLANRMRLKQADKRNATAAVFAHFTNVVPSAGDKTGYITVHFVADGWFWMIPLPGGVMSVGFVADQSAFKNRGRSVQDFFLGRIQASPTVRARMKGATLVTEVVATGNYSYRSGSCWGDRYLMIGDAFAFLDPIFSSGVLLAMTAGEMGADIANTWLDDPARGRAMARRGERQLRRGMDRLSWLIYRINTPVLRGMFMSPRNEFRMRDGLVSLLAGDLRPNWRLGMPIIAFKTAFHLLSVASRFGHK